MLQTQLWLLLSVLSAAPDAPKKALEEIAQGWSNATTLGGSASLSSTRDVVGVENGSTYQLGVVLGSTVWWKNNRDLWATELLLQESTTRAQPVDTFLKSADTLRLRSTFSHMFWSPTWLGWYAQAGLTTQLFVGHAFTLTDVTVVRVLTDGGTRTSQRPALSRIHLSDPFEPTVFLESAGFQALYTWGKRLDVSGKVGLGSQQINAPSAFVVADDASTSELELQQVGEAVEVGAVVEATLKGELVERVNYVASAALFQPVYTTNDPVKEGIEALSADIRFKLSFQIIKPISLDYLLTILRVPVIVDDWQITSSLVLALNYSS